MTSPRSKDVSLGGRVGYEQDFGRRRGYYGEDQGLYRQAGNYQGGGDQGGHQYKDGCGGRPGLFGGQQGHPVQPSGTLGMLLALMKGSFDFMQAN